MGYFEGIESQRGIAWRCDDSLSLKVFLNLEPIAEAPDHSSLTKIGDYIAYYNLERKHSALGYRSPHQFELLQVKI